jgi:hypothetical protein
LEIEVCDRFLVLAIFLQSQSLRSLVETAGSAIAASQRFAQLPPYNPKLIGVLGDNIQRLSTNGTGGAEESDRFHS